jgi:predicted Zn finger-like uncharacterized protein
MKIECPHCHLTGEIADMEIPMDGRHMDCPRCNSSFTVKRKTKAWSPDAMNTCPSCSFSTFSEETFDVCPKCGLICKEYNEKLRRQRETEQLKRDAEKLSQKFAPAVPLPTGGVTAKPAAEGGKPAIPQPVQLTGGAALAVAALLLAYGIWGISAHSVGEIQARMVEQSVEPDSKLRIFIVQILPYWLWTIYGGGAAYVAFQFLQLRKGALQALGKTAWVGLALVVGSQLIGYVAKVMDAATPLFFVIELFSTLLTTLIWAAPVVLLIWFLRHPAITAEFRH